MVTEEKGDMAGQTDKTRPVVDLFDVLLTILKTDVTFRLLVCRVRLTVLNADLLS